MLLDPKEKVGTNFEEVESTVRAILLKKNSAWGSVRVFGNSINNVVSGPNQGAGFVIVVIGRGETCRLIGNPSVRYFHRRSS